LRLPEFFPSVAEHAHRAKALNCRVHIAMVVNQQALHEVFHEVDTVGAE
jgi:hypothetical protein